MISNGRLVSVVAACALAMTTRWLPAAEAPLSHDVYVWQRSWNSEVRSSLEQHGAAFSNIAALSAEISWQAGQPQLTRVAIDYLALRTANSNAALVLRIGPYSGPFAADDRVGGLLVSTAAGILSEARRNGLEPAELQIDFDCADSKLEGYRVWVSALKAAVTPTPVTITALPSWLKQSAFRPLVQMAGGFVLQVHSLERPKSPDAPFTLCDPRAAQAAVEQAGLAGVPFRVALPTYGYVMAFATNGRFVGLSAEGPAKDWPSNVILREVHSDAIELAALVQGWNAQRPENMRGVIWYRLPVEGDILNWRWPTLGTIVAGRSPRESARAEPSRVGSGLVEINLVNDGELDISSRLAVQIRWQNDRLVAGDGLRGFELVEAGASAARLQTGSQPYRLPAGAKQVIGWVRLNGNSEVQLELNKW